jgi:hypothetical protein
MKNFSLLCILLAVLSFTLILNSQESEDNLIQIALLLDTSNSMDGLIGQAKSQLWKIVNEFALARKNGKIPKLQIALYEYGNNSISATDDYIRKVADLTGDLDKISDELFRLTTNGGDEYCGAVIEKAVNGLQWSKRSDILKIIFIAGNEPFTQGAHNYRKSCKDAISHGIIVNTIFCGNYDEGVNTDWKEGAMLADGMYSSIDQDRKIVQISAPQDEEINKLGLELNRTYLGYGEKGSRSKMMQEEQDKKAELIAPSVMAQRSVSKASGQYLNDSWDLVDATLQDPAIIEKLEREQFPEEMQKMSPTERKQFIQKKLHERKKIQDKINALNIQRRAYVAAQEKKNSNGNTLDQAMMNSIRKQAKSRNFAF